MRMNVDDYIKQHDQIRYCEAIITPDGMIEDCVHGHIKLLIKYTGETHAVIDRKMPVSSSPIDWLVSYTKCVSLWYDFCMIPNELTVKQFHAIIKLHMSGCVNYIEPNAIVRTREPLVIL